MPPIIRSLVHSHSFFTRILPIENTRYKQFDLVTKFLYLTDKDGFAATKKRDLDEFVKAYRDKNNKSLARKSSTLRKDVSRLLKEMANVFEPQDYLLKSVGLVTAYFMAFLLTRNKTVLRAKLTRKRLVEFDNIRRENRSLMRQQQAAIARGKTVNTNLRVRQDLAIFDRLMQSPNDSQALEYRFRILKAFLENHQFREALPRELMHKIGEDR